MSELRSHYLNTLGIPEFLHTEIKAQPAPKLTADCLVVENVTKDSFCQQGKIQDFLLKMLAAIGLEKNQVVLLNTADMSEIKNYNAKTVLLMDANFAVKNSFKTHHPANILTNNTLKREAWEVLKQLKQWLK